MSKLENNQQKQFTDLAKAIMPFGKYKDKLLIDLPEYYLVWYRQKGFPKGKLGEQLALVLELKINGLEYLIKNYQKNTSSQ